MVRAYHKQGHIINKDRPSVQVKLKTKEAKKTETYQGFILKPKTK